jgi:hypothetical protein
MSFNDSFIFIVQKQKSVAYLIKHLIKDIVTSFPNVNIAFRICLTTTVSYVEGERSFSKMKKIKNFMHSTTNQDHLMSSAFLLNLL